MEPSENRNHEEGPPGKSSGHDRTKPLPETWCKSRERMRKKYLDIALDLLVSPIGQTQPEVTWQGSPGEAHTEVSVSSIEYVRKR